MAYDVRTRPGAWTRRQANRRSIGVLLIAGAAAALGIYGIFAALGHRMGAVTSILFLGFVLAMKPHADRYVDRAVNFWTGADAEEAVGATLDKLRYEGWHLIHDVEWHSRGNVDHIASGPTGVYLIETKANRYENRHLGKVAHQARELHDELDCWVTPVICLHSRKGEAFKKGTVWIVPHAKLLDWLRAQHNQIVDFERLARFADGL